MSTSTSTRVISDSAYSVPAFNAGDTPVHLEGTAAKLSTAWVAVSSTSTRQGIEKTAATLRDCGLISDEAHRAFLYRIGVRSQVALHAFEEDVTAMANALTEAREAHGEMGSARDLMA